MPPIQHSEDRVRYRESTQSVTKLSQTSKPRASAGNGYNSKLTKPMPPGFVMDA